MKLVTEILGGSRAETGERGGILYQIKQRLTAWRPFSKLRKRTIIAGLLAICILLCGFTWNWVIEFTMRVIFPVEEAVDTEMILRFPDLVNAEDLRVYLTEPVIAEQVVQGVQANLSAGVYDNIQLLDITEESLGKKIIHIIFDRLFS